ncbi:MAG: ankyrin repeat domain-containing protein [Candidatus Sumerlaeia bacterium]
MIGWLRATLPGELALMAVGFAYLIVLGFLPWFDARPFLLGAVLVAYAVYRIAAFHPRMNAEYRHWLELMPWDGTRLPFGPVHLVAQDLIVVAVMILLATVGFFPLRLALTPHAALCWVSLFLLVYVSVAVSLMFTTNMDRFGYGMLFVMILMMYAWWLPWLAFGLLLIAYLIAVAGIRRGYREFPWGMRRKYTEDYDFSANRIGAGRNAMLNPDGRSAATTDILELPGLRLIKESFRFDKRPEYELAGPLLESLSPIEVDGNGRTERALLTSAMIAWGFFVFSSMENTLFNGPKASLVIYSLCIFGANLIRTAIYCASVFPLVNIGTRLLWPRWLVTRYDRSWLTSLAGLLLGILLPLPLIYLGVSMPPALALSTFVYFGLIQRWGISSDEWKLTGRGHLRFRYPQMPGQPAIQFNDAILMYLLGFVCLAGICAALYENAPRIQPKTDRRATVSSGALKLQLLLGANPNRASGSGLTPLETATLAGDNKAIWVLVSDGAVQNYGVNNPLHLAILTSHTQTMTELIRLGADVNIQSSICMQNTKFDNYYNVTPLQLAALTGNIPAAKILIDAKADVRAGYSTTGPPLECALRRGNLEMARLLTSYGAKLELSRPAYEELHDEDGEDFDAIRSICRSGDWDTFQFMLSIYPEFDPRAKAGAAALYGVAEDQAVEGLRTKHGAGIRIAAWLVEHGADVNAKDPDENTSDTVLHCAAQTGRPEMVAFLADHGAIIDAGNDYGATPLLQAIRRERLDNAKILLDRGAQLDLADKYGYTPLLAASAAVNIPSEIVKLLIDRGANPSAVTNERKSAIQLAAAQHSSDDKRDRETLKKIAILLDAQSGPVARAEQMRAGLAAARDAEWNEAAKLFGGSVDVVSRRKPGLNFGLIAVRLLFALAIVLLWVRAAVVVRRPPNKLAPARVRHGWSVAIIRWIRARLGALLIPLLALAAPQLLLFFGCMLVVVFFMLPLPLEENTNFIAVNAALLAGCALYGILRASLLHPVFNKSYREWLGTMPWDPAKPLPMGPAQLVPKDAIAVALVWLLTWPIQWIFPSSDVDRVSFMALALIAILVPYIFVIMLSLIPTGQWTGFFVLAFGAGFIGLFYQNPGWVLLALGVMYAAADIFLGRAIAGFPWKNPRAEPWLGTAGVSDANLAQQFTRELFYSTIIGKTEVGMPQNALVPLDSRLRVPLGHGLMLSVLAGWIVYVLSRIFGAFPDEAVRDWARFREADPLLLICPIALVLCALFRLAVYATGNLPPISFWGRVLTGRWIVPAYDVIFVVPILSVAAMLFLPKLLTRCGVHAIWVYPLAVTISLAILLNLGPTLARWRLTGAHRIVPKNMN